MELDRTARYLEVGMMLAWILLFYFRLRSSHVASGGDWAGTLRTAILPIRIVSAVFLIGGLVLMTGSATQPIAHALVIPTIFAQGMCLALGAFAKRGATGEKGAPIAQPTT